MTEERLNLRQNEREAIYFEIGNIEEAKGGDYDSTDFSTLIKWFVQRFGENRRPALTDKKAHDIHKQGCVSRSAKHRMKQSQLSQQEQGGGEEDVLPHQQQQQQQSPISEQHSLIIGEQQCIIEEINAFKASFQMDKTLTHNASYVELHDRAAEVASKSKNFSSQHPEILSNCRKLFEARNDLSKLSPLHSSSQAFISYHFLPQPEAADAVANVYKPPISLNMGAVVLPSNLSNPNHKAYSSTPDGADPSPASNRSGNDPSKIIGGKRRVAVSLEKRTTGLSSKICTFAHTVDELHAREGFRYNPGQLVSSHPLISNMPPEVLKAHLENINVHVEKQVDQLCEAIDQRAKLLPYVVEQGKTAMFASSSKDYLLRKKVVGHNLTSDGVRIMSRVSDSLLNSVPLLSPVNDNSNSAYATSSSSSHYLQSPPGVSQSPRTTSLPIEVDNFDLNNLDL